MSSCLCRRTRLLIRLQRLRSGALAQVKAKNSLLGVCMYKFEMWSWRRGRLVEWFLLGPGSSARVLSFSLEKFCLGKIVTQDGVSAARTFEAM